MKKLSELNELKHVLSPKAFNAYLDELLTEEHAQRRKAMPKPKPVKKTTVKKKK